MARTDAHRTRPMLRHLLAFTLVLVSILILVEVVARILGLTPVGSDGAADHSTLGWTIEPKSRPSTRPEGAGAKKLVVLGDSFAEARALPPSISFVGLLDTWLRENSGGDQWQVVNLAASGWGSTQQLIAFEEYCRDHQPTIVVWQVFPFNDLCNNSIDLARTCTLRDHQRPYFRRQGDRLQAAWIRPIGRLFRVFLAYRILEAQLTWGNGGIVGPDPTDREKYAEQRADYFLENSQKVGLESSAAYYSLAPPDHQPPVIREAWSLTESIIGKAVDFARRHDIVLIPVVVPLADTFHDYWLRYQRESKDIPFQASYATDRWETIFTELGVAPISVRREINSDPDMGSDDFFYPRGMEWDQHFSRFGHFWIAARIREELCSAGPLRCGLPSPRISISPPVDFLSDLPAPFALRGFTDLLLDTDQGPRRNAFGPDSSIVFHAQEEQGLDLGITTTGLGEERDLQILLNGDLVMDHPVAAGDSSHGTAALQVGPGRVAIRFRFQPWHETNSDSPVQFSRLKLTRQQRELLDDDFETGDLGVWSEPRP